MSNLTKEDDHYKDQLQTCFENVFLGFDERSIDGKHVVQIRFDVDHVISHVIANELKFQLISVT